MLYMDISQSNTPRLASQPPSAPAGQHGHGYIASYTWSSSYGSIFPALVTVTTADHAHFRVRPFPNSSTRGSAIRISDGGTKTMCELEDIFDLSSLDQPLDTTQDIPSEVSH